jgi:hypothetical protein
LYGCEAWSLALTAHRVRIIEKWVLGIMLGTRRKWDGGENKEEIARQKSKT